MCNPLVSRFIARLEQPETSNGLARGLGLGSASNGTLPFLVGLKTGGCQTSDICAADSVVSDDHDLFLVAPCGIGRPCATSLGRSYRRWSVGRVGRTMGCLTAGYPLGIALSLLVGLLVSVSSVSCIARL